MTTYYVGSGGNDGNAGTSWATRKLTLNGAEDIPVVAGDTVYVGAGVYRELLTVDVSGSSGNPITYIGDYSGANTDGVGGVVRITGSDNDQTVTRANGITATSRSYRTFRGLLITATTAEAISLSNCTNVIVEQCALVSVNGLLANGASAASTTVRKCFIASSGAGVLFGTTQVANSGHVVENCIISGRNFAIVPWGVGGVSVRNCLIHRSANGIWTVTLPAGKTANVVNNCIVTLCGTGLQASAAGDMTENYNSLFLNGTDRNNVSSGANSVSYPVAHDVRWFFEAVNGGNMVTPFDLASYAALVELNSGTGAPSADLRGTTVQGSYREWGPLEYDSTLDIEAGGSVIVIED